MNKILKIVTGVLSIFAFCMLFGNQVVSTVSAGSVSQTSNYSFATVFFEGLKESGTGIQMINPNILGFFGYVLVLLAGLLFVVPLFVKKMNKNISLIISAVSSVLLIVGIIFLCCIVSSFASVNKNLAQIKTLSLAATPIIAIVASFINLAVIVFTTYLEHFAKGKK